MCCWALTLWLSHYRLYFLNAWLMRCVFPAKVTFWLKYTFNWKHHTRSRLKWTWQYISSAQSLIYWLATITASSLHWGVISVEIKVPFWKWKYILIWNHRIFPKVGKILVLLEDDSISAPGGRAVVCLHMCAKQIVWCSWSRCDLMAGDCFWYSFSIIRKPMFCLPSWKNWTIL